MKADFIALDVETANEDYGSVCQVGLAFFKDDTLVDTWSSYVNPETYFSDINIEIHGITPEKVKNAMSIAQMMGVFNQTLAENIIAHHMPFDRVALSKCAEASRSNPLPCRWLDSAYTARHTWEAFRHRGCSLSNISSTLGISHQGIHEALDDAIAAGNVIIKAAQASNQTFAQWASDPKHECFFRDGNCQSTRRNGYVDFSAAELRQLAAEEPDQNGILYGEVVVFTGELSINRLDAAKLAYFYWL